MPMNKFFLNNAIGSPKNIDEGSKALADVLYSFRKLLNDESLIISHDVVMECEFAKVKFGEIYLYQLIESLHDPDIKTLAWSFFNKAYPMTDYVGMRDEEYEYVERDYKLDGEDATELAVANNHGLFLFTIAHKAILRQNQLSISATASQSTGNTILDSFVMDSLFGGDENENYIIERLRQCLLKGTSKLDQLKQFGVTSPKLENQFMKLSMEEQKAIIKSFNEAKRMGLLYPIAPNGSLVRSESGWEKYLVAELALPNPFATRVYISQFGQQLFISYIGHKRDYDGTGKQRKDIKKAESIFKKYFNKERT